ncbi:MAG: hypothetical protein A2086_16995 [Spirochaetes bacterium GWD1_27_9]|nr:MAG: hypothetical protein A2Z98_15320 [Spirochaetes bacterium GWB1_27_13]OHD27653.1 MAG: hypothetical protein A2Y34_10675 [Spirochaetes bacterium GWC1_27_15]OHD33327.1 MAG: hypothetical protein A2086_16995 [Spirochaetes bacterium GWD1_27_9]
MSDIVDNKIFQYLLANEEFFIQIFDKFNQNYSNIPKSLNLYPFYDKEEINSLLAYTSTGYFYPFIKEKYIKDVVKIINNGDCFLFSIYGKSKIISDIVKNIKYKPRSSINYYSMRLKKDNFKTLSKELVGYKCIKCSKDHFKYLKNLQYLYHKEEVYNDDSFYPYDAEMESFKTLLDVRLNYAVFDAKNKAISKANVNGESPNFFQIGGIYTLKQYRNMGFSKFCLTNLFLDSFYNFFKKGILLFVKKENIPAITVYQQLGFEILFESTLVYF